MSGTLLTASPAFLGRLQDHLSHGDTEQVAFLLAETDVERNEFRLTDMYAVPDEEFDVQLAFHISLSDIVRPKMIKWAWDRGQSLIEAHSHLQGPAEFSASDLAGLAEFVPHVWWRLGGRPYAALVCAPDSFDALAWLAEPGVAVEVAGIRADGSPHIDVPTGATFSYLNRGSTNDG